MLNGLRRVARLLFSFSGTISRRTYVTVAFVAVLVKHIVDVVVATRFFHQQWGPLNYWAPPSVFGSIFSPSLGDKKFLLIMLALAAPFAWLGLALTAKRFRTIGWPLWLVVLFFVPIANIGSFLVAAATPDRPSAGDQGGGWFARIAPRDAFGAAISGVFAALAFGLLFGWLATHLLVSYGWGLFAALPFLQGAIAVVFLNAHERRGLTASMSVAALCVALTAAALLAVAFEGAICIAMALPLALFFALLGALFAHAIMRRAVPQPGPLLMLAAIVPLLMGADVRAMRTAATHLVETSIVVEAPPQAVWEHVIKFPDLAVPTEWPFRLGIAYPVRARIVGSGVGAMRYCEFSTGDFVEPITAWEAGRRLAFDVVKNPAPMREWSPYGQLDTPHLHDYLTSRRGEFVLQPLPGGRTLLIGRTWYRHHLWPDAYWTVWADEIIHAIHKRVLVHIQRIAERAGR